MISLFVKVGMSAVFGLSIDLKSVSDRPFSWSSISISIKHRFFKSSSPIRRSAY